MWKKIILRFLICAICAIGIAVGYWWIDTTNPSFMEICFAALDMAVLLGIVYISVDCARAACLGNKEKIIWIAAIWLIATACIISAWMAGCLTLWLLDVTPQRFELTVLLGGSVLWLWFTLFRMAEKISNMRQRKLLNLFRKIWTFTLSWLLPVALAIGLAVVLYVYVLI